MLEGPMQPCLLIELAEIYSTPTPKGWHEAEKSNLYLLIGCLTLGLIFIPWAMDVQNLPKKNI